MESKFLQTLMRAGQVSVKLFPLSDSEGMLNKAADELRELRHERTRANRVKELADVLICLSGFMEHEGITFVEIADEVDRKTNVNINRKWKYNPKTKTYQHEPTGTNNSVSFPTTEINKDGCSPLYDGRDF